MLNGDFNYDNKGIKGNKCHLYFRRILRRILKNPFKQEVSKVTRENIKKEKNTNTPKKNINLYEKYSTIDRSPLSENTLNLIALFKDTPKNKKISKMGGKFELEGVFIEKLSQYEVFINYLIDNSKNEKLPTVSEIMKNFKYGDEKLSSDKIIRNFKEEGVEKGDLYQKTLKGNCYLKRTEKY